MWWYKRPPRWDFPFPCRGTIDQPRWIFYNSTEGGPISIDLVISTTNGNGNPFGQRNWKSHGLGPWDFYNSNSRSGTGAASQPHPIPPNPIYSTHLNFPSLYLAQKDCSAAATNTDLGMLENHAISFNWGCSTNSWTGIWIGAVNSILTFANGNGIDGIVPMTAF